MSTPRDLSRTFCEGVIPMPKLFCPADTVVAQNRGQVGHQLWGSFSSVADEVYKRVNPQAAMLLETIQDAVEAYRRAYFLISLFMVGVISFVARPF